MLAILFLVLCITFGISLVKLCVPDTERLFAACSPSKNITEKISGLVFTVPAGITIGLITVSTVLYYAMSLISRLGKSPVFTKNLTLSLVCGVFLLLTVFNFYRIIKNSPEKKTALIPDYKSSIGKILFYGLSTVGFAMVASFLMFYTYRIVGTELWGGYTVYSDLSPHTAMTSSFGVGFNFPTQYIHFAGDGIQYHFFFYFLCGMLQYLGFPIDWAINVPSIIVMVCCFELLGLLAVIFSRRKVAFIIAPVLVLFRSSFNVFYRMKELSDMGIGFKDSMEAISKTDFWYKVTPFDDWGIWAINVYPNQRHLMLGMSVILILVILFTPFVRRMGVSLIKNEKKNKVKTFAFCKEAWLPRKEDPLCPVKLTVLSCILVICMPFFHGSALIGGLLVLFGMALISESRLLYAAVAASALISSFIQTKLFSGGADNVVKFQYMPGFVVEDKSVGGIVNYLAIVTGITIVLCILYGIYLYIHDKNKEQPVYRSLLMICFCLPLIFAFTFQVSLEMLANHKFIQFTLILLDIFVAAFLSELFVLPSFITKSLKKASNIIVRTSCILVAVALLIPLTGTGISEWFSYVNMNSEYRHIVINTESELAAWIIENTEPDDVFLTPMWSLNRFSLTGRPMYYGWPYYAYSAGHDTYVRQQCYAWILGGCEGDAEALVNYCRSRNIRYIIDDPDLYYNAASEGFIFNEMFLAENLTPVAYFPNDNNTVIYQVY